MPVPQKIFWLWKNRQDACSTRQFFGCGRTGKMPVLPQKIFVIVERASCPLLWKNRQDACSTKNFLLLWKNRQDACSTKNFVIVEEQARCLFHKKFFVIVERASCPFNIFWKFYQKIINL
ncbi:hypothetical protein [Microcoleus sp. D3_18_C2]|uniref:hypothetical protein n=1 Tax=Microcoleus sp. D3_18_C2 TaxID=3055334 RepID=UPI002FD45D90